MKDDMSNLKRDERPLRVQNVPGNVARRHAEKITEDAVKSSTASSGDNHQEDQYSLNDDRRVRVLSPGALVAKRFFRNRIALVGLIVLAFMFAFSFIGGLISPYKENQLFYRYDYMNKEYAGVKENDEFRYVAADGQKFDTVIQAQLVLAIQKGKDSFSYRKVDYTVKEEGDDFYSVSLAEDGTMLGIAYKDIVSPSVEGTEVPFQLRFDALKAYAQHLSSFTSDGKEYTMDEGGVVYDGDREVIYVSRYVVNSVMSDVFISRAFKEELAAAINSGSEEFYFTDPDGTEHEYTIRFEPKTDSWSVLQATATRVYDTYSAPSKEHWLGTDRNGMDMLTRLMYGGRVSLLIGFIVEIIATVIGIILGGIAGYFGKWVDNLIMRIVDVFYCIPSTPIIIILGAAMDAMRVDPKIRMIYLMLILGFLSWPGLARMVRGQILSLREQEFMTATESSGLSISRRIFKHLVPNVIPLLIVSCTMGLGSTIITEATLSFLGLGVKFPFASWGNIINDVNNTHVLTTYWFIWIPAGVLLLATVLAFNLVGDGLRDAFDPKMKR